MSMSLNDDDLLKVSGGTSGLSAADIKQIVIQYLQQQGLDTGSASEKELKTLIYSLGIDGRNTLYDYLLSQNIEYAEFPTWLQDCFLYSTGYDTEEMLNMIIKAPN